MKGRDSLLLTVLTLLAQPDIKNIKPQIYKTVLETHTAFHLSIYSINKYLFIECQLCTSYGLFDQFKWK